MNELQWVMKKLKELDKPFIIIMPSSKINTSYFRASIYYFIFFIKKHIISFFLFFIKKWNKYIYLYKDIYEINKTKQ
jgi:hypothetical protein